MTLDKRPSLRKCIDDALQMLHLRLKCSGNMAAAGNTLLGYRMPPVSGQTNDPSSDS